MFVCLVVKFIGVAESARFLLTSSCLELVIECQRVESDITGQC